MQDKDQGTTDAQDDTQHLLPSEPFVEDDGGEQEGDDRHGGGHDAGIGGSGETQPDGEATLVGDNAEKTCSGKEQTVAPADMFVLTGQPPEHPETEHTTHHAEGD